MTNHYSYEACDIHGKVHKGILSAESEQETVGILQAKQLIPVNIEETTNAQKSSLFANNAISNNDVIDFTNGLCTLMEAYVPLDRALLLLEGITEKPAVQELTANLRREVKEGKSLADALQTHTQTFSRMYINMVHAGEEGGILDKLLPRLASFLEDADEAKRTIISSLIYPIILSIVGILSVILLLVFVVPQFATLFEDMGAATPASAQFLLSLSEWMQNYWWSLVLVPFIAIYTWKYLNTTKELRLWRDTKLLDVPLLGQVLLQSEVSKFCRTLGALLSSGIPLLKALNIARGVMENNFLSSKLEQVEESVRSGISLGKALGNIGHFPVLLSQLIIVGEESGRTAAILDKLAESFNMQVKQQTTRLVELLNPLLILSLGIVIGAIVSIMLSAIYSINEI
jgi:general secretion pathway protein F